MIRTAAASRGDVAPGSPSPENAKTSPKKLNFFSVDLVSVKPGKCGFLREALKQTETFLRVKKVFAREPKSAQLHYESGGWGFDSLRVHQFFAVGARNF